MSIRQKDYEKLSSTNVQKVVDLLNQDDPITKKEACEILNIRYNTTRLQRIIDDHLELWEYKNKRKEQKKGTGATKDEISEVLQMYVDGDNISTIAESLYRSNAFVKAVIQRVGIPQRLSKEEHSKCYRHKYQMLPEQCVAEQFEDGELVWAVKDNKIAKVLRELTPEYMESKEGYVKPVTSYEKKYGSKGYSIYVYDPVPQEAIDKSFFPWLDGRKVGYYSFSLAYDLGSLRHLEQYGVKLV